MATDPGQTSSRVEKFVIYLLVISALIVAVVLVGLIWQSQTALDDHHLTYVGAQILLWDPENRMVTNADRFRRKPVDRVLDWEDLTFTPAAAKYFATNYKNYLNLDVIQLSPAAAKGLSQTPYGLHFTHLKLASPELLAALVSGPCPHLTLPIPNLTEAGAKALSQFKGDNLTVTEMTHLSPEAAKALSRCETESLNLSGLDHLSEEAAEELSRCRAGYLSVRPLESISETTAAALSRYPGILSLSVPHISETVATAFSRFQGEKLRLAVSHISETTASALSRFQGEKLHLDVSHISEEVAVALSHYPGFLQLSNLKTLPDAAAHALAGRKLLKVGWGPSDGPHQLEKLPASAAAILREANNNSQ